MIDPDIERAVMVVAQRIWRETLGAGLDEAAALEAIHALLLREVTDPGHVTEHEATIFALDFARYAFALLWLHGGCVTLTTGHKFAAALAASKMREPDLLLDAGIPARAFRVQIPEGVLIHAEHQRGYSQANVALFSDGTALFLLEGHGPRHRISSVPTWLAPTEGQHALSLILDDSDIKETEWFLSDEAAAQQSVDELEAKKRMVQLAKRIVAGLLLTYAHTTNWKNLGRSTSRSGPKRDGPPPHRTIFVGRPLDIDARSQVLRYIGGSRACPPSVQSLVCGHHKRQAFGVGRSGRKVIWIEPYWRGPEDAPILARPLRVRAD